MFSSSSPLLQFDCCYSDVVNDGCCCPARLLLNGMHKFLFFSVGVQDVGDSSRGSCFAAGSEE